MIVICLTTPFLSTKTLAVASLQLVPPISMAAQCLRDSSFLPFETVLMAPLKKSKTQGVTIPIPKMTAPTVGSRFLSSFSILINQPIKYNLYSNIFQPCRCQSLIRSVLIMEQLKRINVWLDCDPGLDDCFAIILAAGHPRLNLLGVSTSAGNTTVEYTTKNAVDMLFHIGRSDVPVFMGSRESLSEGAEIATEVHGEKGLGGVELATSNVVAITENSFEHIRQRIMGADGKVAFICTGALTNLALLLHTNPLIKEKISLVSIMGGASGKGNKTPAAQFNIYFDPVAARCVFKSKMNIVMVPLEVTHTNLATVEIRTTMAERNSSVSRTLINLIEKYGEVYKTLGFTDPPLHDPCAVFYVLEPHQFVTQKAKVSIDMFPMSMGRTNIEFRENANQVMNAHVCTSMNVKRFWEVMLELYKDMIPSD